MKLRFDPSSLSDYETFLAVRRAPVYRFQGHAAEVPDEYAAELGIKVMPTARPEPVLSDDLYDYQRDIARIAIQKRKFAIFADCGMGKTLMLLEFARHVVRETNRKCLIVSPLMVVDQTCKEAREWFPGMKIAAVAAADLETWMAAPADGDAMIGVTNYEAIRAAFKTQYLGGIILDESSYLKNHYGSWGLRLIEMGRGVPFKLCCTGTPAPNDRIEFANHAVFMDQAKTSQEFLATYFINRGQTQNRWELKPHATAPFYRALSTWAIFLTNPATYGWKDNVEQIPPIHIHTVEVPLTPEQRKAAQSITGSLVTANVGGISMRGKLSQIAKGKGGIPTNKPEVIRSLVASWPDESTIIWCHYNDEQDAMARLFPEAVNITGSTKQGAREKGIQSFKNKEAKVLISKPKILGFGLNLQVATRQIFSGLKDSYEEFYQAVKRSNRIGSTRPLNVHIPVTELEIPFLDNVLSKAHRVEADTQEQERIFRKHRHDV